MKLHQMGGAEVALKTTKRLLEENIGTDGNLQKDSLAHALLQLTKSSDKDCILSPAEVLFGRTFKDAMPKLDKSKMIFENPQIHNQWREAWSLKEEALKARLVRSTEKLEEHSKDLEPLAQGDNVFIQNQDSSSKDYKKWSRQGTVVIAGKYDQYLVRVHGTGRLTVRNRRFLRRFTLRSPTVENVSELPRISSKDLAAPKPVTDTTHHNVKESRKIVSQHDEPVPRDLPSITDEQKQNLPLGERSDTASSPVAIEEGPKSPTYVALETKPTEEKDTPPLRRSCRERIPRKLYDPTSGTYKTNEH